MRNLIYGAILALSTNAERQMRMVMQADNIWTLNVYDANGVIVNQGPVDDWNVVTTIEKTLTGNGTFPFTL